MTSPATGIASTPYRAAGWTPQGYAPTNQQPYRYTTPIPQQATYATYTPHTTSVSFPIQPESGRIDVIHRPRERATWMAFLFGLIW